MVGLEHHALVERDVVEAVARDGVLSHAESRVRPERGLLPAQRLDRQRPGRIAISGRGSHLYLSHCVLLLVSL